MTSPRPADPTGASHQNLAPTRTRASAAWTLAAVAAFLGLLMLIFIFQNSGSVPLKFLFFEGSAPLGAALLLAAVLGALIVGLLGAGRLLQLRLAARRHRRAGDPIAPPAA
jgi:uncharacterized integral membrane protein